MPWEETRVTQQRMRFVLACLDGEDSISELCRRFGVSRPTGYEWLGRYREFGPAGLIDRSPAPHSHPNQTPAGVESLILAERARHPTWGARKLLAALARRCGREGEDLDLPAASTVGAMLRRHGLAAPRRRRRHSPPAPDLPAACGCAPPGPNRLWNADFKGWFRTLDGSRCDPLTVTDSYSRYLLRCQVAPDLGHDWARAQFEAAFREHGLPDAIRTDNGAPFATTGLAGLGRLSAWWVRLGIAHVRIDPGRPQQNGGHERMHGTLKRETADPPARTLRAQQARFDAFAREYNHDRPHEGLPGMATPASLYEDSPRAYPGRLPELEYPDGHVPRHVDANGRFRWGGARVFLGHALAGQTVGLLPLGVDPADCPGGPGRGVRYWAVRFAAVELGVFDERRGRLLRPRERRPSEPT